MHTVYNNPLKKSLNSRYLLPHTRRTNYAATLHLDATKLDGGVLRHLSKEAYAAYAALIAFLQLSQ